MEEEDAVVEDPKTLGEVDVEDAPNENAVGVDPNVDEELGACHVELNMLELLVSDDVATAEPRPKLGPDTLLEPRPKLGADEPNGEVPDVEDGIVVVPPKDA